MISEMGDHMPWPSPYGLQRVIHHMAGGNCAPQRNSVTSAILLHSKDQKKHQGTQESNSWESGISHLPNIQRMVIHHPASIWFAQLVPSSSWTLKLSFSLLKLIFGRCQDSLYISYEVCLYNIKRNKLDQLQSQTPFFSAFWFVD